MVTGLDAGWQQTFGYQPEEIIGQPLTLLLAEESHEPFRRACREGFAHEASDNEVLLRMRDAAGRYCCVAFGATPLYGKTPETTQYSCVIQESCQVDLAELERQPIALDGVLAQIFNHAPLLMSVTTVEDGTYLMVNDTFLHKTGFRREEVIGRTSVGVNLVSAADRNVIRQEVLRHGRVRDLPLQLIRADGTSMYCTFSTELFTVGDTRLLLSYAQDSTEQLEDKARLMQQTESLAAIFDSAPSFLALFNDRGQVERLNQKGVELSAKNPRGTEGLQTGELLACVNAKNGQRCGLSLNCHKCQIRSLLETSLSTGESHLEEEARLILEEGEGVREYHFLASTTPMRIKGEQKVLLSLTDITGAKKLQEEKNGLRRQLFQSQKMESIGRLAGGVAHDLNNLLVPILGYAEMMSEDLHSEDPKREQADQIVEAGRRASDLLRQLLAFSRKQKLSLAVIDINTLLKNFEGLLRRTLREDIIMRLALGHDLPAIRGDKGQLEQVLMNLVVNAQDAMADGGTLVIETAPVTLLRPESPSWESFSPGEHVRIRISDTGIGMAPELVERIFEPFFTTKPVDQGTGLGLSTVHGIIVQHGGAISVSSEPGQGTVFQILLPSAQARPVEADDEELRVETSSGTVLVVEDDDRLRELLVRALSRRGYTLHASENGSKALEFLETHGAAIDLLLTDVVMPGINGRELYERARRKYPGLKVLYMSGHDRDILSRRGIEEGTVQLIEKPFSINNLVIKLREIAAAASHRRQQPGESS